ncbi:hypothetical protein [Pseudomonas putida]|nr:hypothetical protein [Pseudomonas putida]HDS0965888.1 hypothetical protein [Pseudomonas putida]HDS0991144.1 hypothetical protein [Pseudomonas putida]
MHTVSVQFIYILSQLLLLLAFFLPLKAIIVLSSGGIPSYFPEFLKAYAQDTVVIWLSLSSLVAFAAHLTLELAATKITARGARLLIIRTKKIVLFDNQDSIAINAYSKFTRGLSELLFFLISVAILCAIYPLIFSLIATSITVFYILTCLAYSTSSRVRAALTIHHQVVLNSISGFIFLVVFFGIIGDFLYLSPPSAFMAIISLLLIRQALQRLVGFSSKLILLRSQHSRVSALFFHNQPLLLETAQKSDEIHSLFSPEQRERWIPQVLSPLFKTAFTVEGVKNFQLGQPDIYCYEVNCSSESTLKTYIIKLFDESRTYPATQESALIAQFKDLPCPPLRETGKLQNVTYHIFEWSKECKMTGREYNQGALTLLGDLMKLTPPKSLLNKYERSKSYLESRLNIEMLESLKLYAVTADDQKNIEQLADSLGSIKLHLSKLPRQLIALDLSTDSLLKKETGELSVLHWGNWLLEPAGTYWPLTAHSKLIEYTREAQGTRTDAQSLSSDGTILASYMFSFERHINRRDYQAALNLIPDVLKHAQNLDEQKI